MNVTATRGLDIKSLRFAVVGWQGTDLAAECGGKQDCSPKTVTCEDIKTAGMDDPHLNVALSNARNADSMNGTITQFNDVPVGLAPIEAHYVVVEGRTSTLGNGAAVSFGCANASAATVSVVLEAL
jgi:hypothetical protein